MINTEIKLIMFFAAKDGEALYSQQKQDWELTVAQIMNCLLPNSDSNWRKKEWRDGAKAKQHPVVDVMGDRSEVLCCKEQYSIGTCNVRSIPFLYWAHFAWNVPLTSLIFLKRSLVFPILLFSSSSLHWSLRKAFLSLLAILWDSAFKWVYHSFSPLPLASLLFSAICKASSENHFAFLHSFFLGMVLIILYNDASLMPPVQCHKLLFIVLQALCLSDLIPWIYSLLPLYNHKGFDLGHT